VSETNSFQFPDQTTGPTRSADTEATKNPDLAGHALFERVGVGGMGEIYRCGDDALGRDLAIKILKAELQGNADAEERFLREARLTGSLQHPGIVPVHHLGRLTDNRPYYTMKLVHGRTLADILRDEPAGPERLPRLLAIIEKVCQAVAYAHSKGVIHRDLKPSNVMVGEFGEVQVMDWGLAKELSRVEPAVPPDEATANVETVARVEEAAGLSRAGAALGTPSYMPPEQAAGDWDIVDERADVFALGAILCQVLTGRPPYYGANRDDLLRRARRGDLAETLGRLEKCGADETLIALCRDCLAPERTGRPRNAEHVAQRVATYQAAVQERLRQAELAAARAAVQAQEERKRRRWAIAFVLLLLAGTALSTWLAVRATDAEKKATEQRDQAEKARQDTAEERDRALKAEADTKAVLGFFQDNVLSAGRPKDQEGGLGNKVTLREAVDAAESAIVEAFADRPLVEASIRNTLGSTYRYLGDYPRAIQQHERALALREAKLGVEHPDTLSSRNNLAAAYWSAGRTAEAIRLEEQNLKQREAKLGPEHPDTLTSRGSLAMAYLSVGRIAEAIRLFEQTLQQMEAKLGPEHPHTIQSRSNLAFAYDQAGEFAKAEPLCSAALDQMRKRYGTEDARTAGQMATLAANLLHQHKYADAKPLLRDCLKVREAKQPDVWTTFNTQSLLGEAILGQKKYAEAEPLLLQGYQGMRERESKIPANGKIRLTEALERLVRLYEATGKKDQADKWRKEQERSREADAKNAAKK
jgi:hypothetical protein